MAEEIFCEEYASSMKDLTFNSKPHITMLTMLAEENIQYAPQIVKVIEAHLQKVRPEAKLPAMYLIDSILKNVGQVYQSLFTQNIVSNFCSVFEKVDEKVRAQMYKLRQTWTEIFPNKKLYAIDIRVKEIDPAWPILAQPPPQQSIHVNPRFLKLPAEENNANKKAQEVQEEEMRQQLLAKQQELLKLQRQKLELELLQTQVLVEEQKRQLILKEQQLRAHQNTTEVQKALTLQQQLTNVAALAAASQNIANADGQKSAKQGKVPGTKEINNSLSVPTPAILPLVTNSKNTPSVGVLNKKAFGGQLHGDPTATIVSTNVPTSASSSKHSTPPMSTSSGHNSLPHTSKQGSISQSSEINKDSERVQAKGLSLKVSPRKGVTDKSGKDTGKSKDDSKKQSPSPKKTKSSKADSKSSDLKHKSSSKSSKTSSSDKDKRSRSKSLSPLRGKGDTSSLRGQSRKGDRWQSSMQNRDRRTVSHSRPRSPSRQDKGRDRDERTMKRGRRSPRREKENEGKSLDGSRNKGISVARDVDLRTSLEHVSKGQKRDNRSGDSGSKSDKEPPYKKSKTGDPELEEIFGDKDQDYRQLDQPIPKLSPISERQGWAQYKASRPDEFKNPLRSRDNHLDPRDPFYFGKHDLDLRTPGPGTIPGVRGGGMGYANWNVRDSRGVPLGRDNRQLRSDRLPSQTGSSRGLSSQDPRLHMQNRSVCYQATQESDPNIPRALMFDRGAEIMKQADLQLKCGQLTVEQHREILEQLAKLYELQRMRHLQREQRMRESMMMQPEAEVITISPDCSPGREEQGSSSDTKKHDCAALSSENETPLEKPEIVAQEDQSGRRPDEEPKIVDSTEPSTSHMSPRISIPDTKLGSDISLPNRNDTSPAVSSQDSTIPQQQQQHDRSQPDCAPILQNEVINREEKEPPQAPFPSALPTPSPTPRHRGFQKPQPIHTVMIDDKPREVRFFGDTAVVLLDNNDPREIAFRGPPQEVIIGKQVVRLGFREKNKDVEVDGCRYPIRFGAPTREIIINDTPYSAVFGGPPIAVMLGGKQYNVRLCGPTPEVYFGDKPRFDLLPQITPESGGRPGASSRDSSSARRGSPPRWVTSTIGRDYEPRDWRHGSARDSAAPYPPQRQEWHDEWRGGRYGEEQFRHERGAFRDDRRPPPPLNRGDYRDFEPWGRRGEPGHREDFRPGTRGSLAGRGHPGRRGSPQTMMDDYYERESRSSPYREPVDTRGVGGSGGGAYYQDGRFGHGPQMMGSSHQGIGQVNAPPHRFDNPGGGLAGPPHQMPHHAGLNNQGMRYGGCPPYGYGPQSIRGHRYPPQGHPEYGYQPSSQPIIPGVPRFQAQMPVPQPQLNIQDLFEKLVSTGIIPQVTTSTEKKETDEEVAKSETTVVDGTKAEPEKEKPPIIELNSESLKVKYPIIISQLYCGIQCSSCGVRFTAEQTDKYAQHLDWHFRQNRKEKDSARKALSRKWYYDVQDWVQFEEIEDLEERARSFFEIQASEEQAEGAEDSQPSVPASENEEDKKCAVCHELFESYWNEDSEEWHYRMAIREDDKNYHPLCYEDFKEQQLQEANTEDKLGNIIKESETSEVSEMTEIPTEEVPSAEEAVTKLETTVVSDDKGIADTLTDAVMEDLKQHLADVKVKEEPISLVMDSEEPAVEESSDCVVKMETEPESLLNPEETSEKVESVSIAEPGAITIKTEPESLEEEQYEPLPIFNVLSCTYTVPPLIGLEVDEVPESNTAESNVAAGEPESEVENIPVQAEVLDTLENVDAINAKNAEPNVPSEVQENVDGNDGDADDITKVLLEEERAEVSSSMNDGVDTEEQVSSDRAIVTSDNVLDQENVEVSSSGVSDDVTKEHEAAIVVKAEPVEHDETEISGNSNLTSVLRREPVECDENEATFMPESGILMPNLEEENNQSVGTLILNDTLLDKTILEGEDRDTSLDAHDGRSPPILGSSPPVVLPVQVKMELDEDVSLKESSDVLSEFAFDSVPSPNENSQQAKDCIFNANDKEDDGPAAKDIEEQTEEKSTFVVMPPVTRGTELSGLCTIM